MVGLIFLLKDHYTMVFQPPPWLAPSRFTVALSYSLQNYTKKNKVPISFPPKFEPMTT